MTTLPLTPDECAALRALMAPEARVADKTAARLTASVGPQVLQALNALERREPPVVQRIVDEGVGVEFWDTTYHAADAYDDHCE